MDLWEGLGQLFCPRELPHVDSRSRPWPGDGSPDDPSAPTFSDVNLLLGSVRLCVHCRDYANAERILLKGLETAPTNPDLLLAFAVFLFDVDRKPDVAMMYIEEVIRMSARHSDALALWAWGKFVVYHSADHAMDGLAKLDSLPAPATCAALWRLGELQWRLRHDVAAAAASFESAIAQDCDDSNALGAYARMLASDQPEVAQARNYEAANIFFIRALETDPFNDEMEHEYAVMLHKTGQHDRAEDHFRRAVELCPTKGEYLYNLAVLLHVVQKRPKQAASLYAKCLKLEGGATNVNAMCNLAILLDEELHDFEKAELLYKQALRINPRHKHTLCSYAKLLHTRRHKHAEAASCYEKVLAIDAHEPAALHNYAVLVHTIGKDYLKAEMLCAPPSPTSVM